MNICDIEYIYMVAVYYNSMCQIKTTKFDGIPVRVYNPAVRGSKTPALIWIHGGGFITGSAG